jgi:cardiolipin synthase
VKILKSVFNRLFIVGFSILAQLVLFFFILFRLNEYFTVFSILMSVLSFVVAVFIINRDMITEAKISWIIIALILPVFGPVLYLIFSNYQLSKREKKSQNKIYPKFFQFIKDDIDCHEKVSDMAHKYKGQFQYIHNVTGLPAYKNTRVEFYPMGECFFDSLVDQLQKAQKYIFMEYFIVDDGIMWQRIFEILKSKASQGVDVRFMYDDLGTVKTLPWNFDKTLKKHGIKCVKFNPFKPVVSERHNNRDHRKITVIDGKIAFVGGINIADEYINKKERFGVWKDSAVMLRGDAVKSFVLLFLKSYCMQSGETEDFSSFLDIKYTPSDDNDIIMPYGDEPNPEDMSYVAENVYLNIINQAERYLWITTPYLIIDEKMENALIRASQRGVDVRIVTPHIPDKKIVFAITRASYLKLITAGIKIFEYAPGFLHSKQVLCDDVISTVGTVNLDYRSFIHHYECGVLMYNDSCNKDIKKDFENMFEVSLDMKDFRQNRFVLMLCRIMMAFTPML